jgi:hypothetical protein
MELCEVSRPWDLNSVLLPKPSAGLRIFVVSPPINDLAFHSDVVHKTNCHISNRIGRENSHLDWKKDKMNAKGVAQTYVKKRSNFCYVERDISLLEYIYIYI